MADFDSKLPIRGLAADVHIDEAQIGGNNISVNTGNSDSGTQRVVLASDQPDVATNLDKVGGVAITLGQKTSANSVPVVIASDQSDVNTNEDKIAGTAISVNTGNADAGTQRVVLATNQPAVPVSFTDSRAESPQYNTATAIAANASSTQSYTPGATVNLDGVDASASGQMKVEIQHGTTGSETTKVVLFTSKGNLNATWRLPFPLAVTSAQTVKVIRTNLDNQAMDVYSTILVH